MTITSYLFEKFKYNGKRSIYYTCYPLLQTAERVVAWQPRGTYIHHHKGDWEAQRDHLLFFFPGQGYSIMADYEADGRLRHCYCDIIAPWQPPAADVANITILDLELDLAVEPSGRYRILDADEFAQAVIEMGYPAELATYAEQTLQELITSATHWRTPFAQIPVTLPRADLHELASEGDAMRTALLAMGLV